MCSNVKRFVCSFSPEVFMPISKKAHKPAQSTTVCCYYNKYHQKKQDIFDIFVLTVQTGFYIIVL